jgi:predicted Fe-S protein YdhL (DUF1289 family)
MDPARDLQSPCVSLCRLDPELGAEDGGLCVGCLRSIDEIIAWGTASDLQKHQILARVAERRQRLGECR